uniref:protein-serine/threonine phosphatase n=1 Tax=Trichobilharzia regenti TaxID=157069 RepID=A0AA85JKW1_TRIRE|nr:unnamed protein product [Trichobilharzia regenti]
MASTPGSAIQSVCVPDNVIGSNVVHWRIHRRQLVNPSVSVCELLGDMSSKIDIKAPGYGWVTKIKDEGAKVTAGCVLFNFLPCTHHVVMKDLCAECGANLRREGGSSGERITDASASIPMVHTIPELHVSETVADEIALQDQQSLLAARKLVLLVDLDQTIIHTTNDPQAFQYGNVHRYCLPGSPLVYHTRLRPHLEDVLDRLSYYYQMHICTFGNRVYAHQLASLIDPKRKYFSQRILSRDECFNPVTKSANLKALFPRGLNLVCIIDDRGEVWDWSPNLIHVKPYRFFPDIGDINAFPWLSMQSQLACQPSTSSSPLLKSKTQTLPDTQLNQEKVDVNENVLSDDINETVTNSGDLINDNTTINTATSFTISKSEMESDSRDGNPVPSEKQDIDSCKLDTCLDEECSSSIISPTPFVNNEDKTDNNTTTAVSTNVNTPLDSNNVNTENPNEIVILSPTKTMEEEMDALDDDYLLRLQEILLRIHRNYFKTYDLYQQRNRKKSINKSVDDKRKHSEYSADPSSSSSSSSPVMDNLSKSSSTRNTDVSISCNNLPHVSDIIAKLRKTVLGPTCHVTLSGLSPAHFPADRCLAGRIVRSLGCILHAGLRLPSSKQVNNDDNNNNSNNNENDKDTKSSAPVDVSQLKSDSAVRRVGHHTTHLIACRRGTEKVHAALKYLADNFQLTNVNLSPPSSSFYLVSPQWLWACHYHWEHVSETKYPLNHDFHPSDFDPDIEPIPGTIRYARRMRRYYNNRGFNYLHTDHHHHHRQRRHRHHHHHHHHHRRHSHHDDHHLQNKHSHKHHVHHRHQHSATDLELCSSINSEVNQKVPCLDPSIVRSALDSIRTERENDRKRKLERKSIKNKKHHKRHRKEELSFRHTSEETTSLADKIGPTPPTNNDQEEEVSGNESSSSSSSPSLKSDSSVELDDKQQQQQNSSMKQIKMNESTSKEIPLTDCSFEQLSSPADSNVTCQIDISNCFLWSEDNFHQADEIKDEGDQDFDECTTENCTELEEEEAVDEEEKYDELMQQYTEDNDEMGLSDLMKNGTNEAEQLKAQLNNYLPPPTRLVLADNPLMHLPPDATGQMLAEIEDAVLEEETERACSLPREAEIYDPAVGSFDDSSSSDDSSFDNNQTSILDKQSIQLTQMHKPHSSKCRTIQLSKNPIDSDRRTLYWQGWSPEEQIRDATKLNLQTHRQWFPRSSRNHHHHHHHQNRSNRLSVSPAIHSDPEPTSGWWLQDSEDTENKEWNTCPEGYDYADAERTRELLYDSRRDRYESCKYDSNDVTYKKMRHGNLTRCLFGADDNPEVEAEDDEEDDAEVQVSDLSVGDDSGEAGDEDDDDDDDDDEEEDFTNKCWDPLREFM